MDPAGDAGDALRGAPRSGPVPVYDVPSLLLLACAVTAGAVLGWLVAQVAPGSGRSVEAFRRDPWYTIWSGISAISCALGLLLGYSGFRLLRRLLIAGSHSTGMRARLVGLLVGYVALGVVIATVGSVVSVQVLGGQVFPLTRPILRTNIFAAVGFGGALPSGIGLWWILLAARDMGRASADAARFGPGMLETFLRYQESAQAFLGMTSTIVAAGVAQTSALRRALLGSGIVEEDDYPPDFVLVYGALFALAVALLYLPTIVTLRETGRALCNNATGHISATSDGSVDEIEHWLDLQDRRQRLNQALGLDLTVITRIQLTLGLLAPFLVSLLATVLPGAK